MPLSPAETKGDPERQKQEDKPSGKSCRRQTSFLEPMESSSLAERKRRPEKDQSRSGLPGSTRRKRRNSERSGPVFHVSSNQNRAYFCSPSREFLWSIRFEFRRFSVTRINEMGIETRVSHHAVPYSLYQLKGDASNYVFPSKSVNYRLFWTFFATCTLFSGSQFWG